MKCEWCGLREGKRIEILGTPFGGYICKKCDKEKRYQKNNRSYEVKYVGL